MISYGPSLFSFKPAMVGIILITPNVIKFTDGLILRYIYLIMEKISCKSSGKVKCLADV